MTNLINTLNADYLVKITPSVITAGIGVSYMNGLIITNNSVVPQGTIKEYSSYQAVVADFTATSTEASMAEVYFASYTNAINTPATLYFYGVGSESIDGNAIMNNVVSKNQSFAGFTTSFPLTTSELETFATWTGAQNNRFWFVAVDTDANILTNPESSFGQYLQNQNLSGTTAIYKDFNVAAFCLGWLASLDFSQTNGRTNLALRNNGLLTPTVTNSNDYDKLISAGYNLYVAFANGLGRWQLFANGTVSGPFKWADSFADQIWINGSIQGALIDLLLNQGSIPYNQEGDALIRSAINGPMREALNFGAIRSGIDLSDEQIADLRLAAGADIASTVQNTGYYIQSNASNTPAPDRAARRSPPIRVFYTDGQSVQSINVNSIEVL